MTEERRLYLIEYKRQWRKDNIERVRAQDRGYAAKSRADGKKQDPEWYAEYYAKNKERLLAGKVEYRQNNLEELRAKQKVRYRENIEAGREQGRQRYAANAEINRQKAREYRAKNPGSHSKYAKARRQSDLYFRLSTNIRTRISTALRKGTKRGSAIKLLGCSVDEFRKYIQSLFRPGMSWDNYSFYGWHIDHIKPLCTFDLTDPKQAAEACHYSNLQPLWAHENFAKGRKRLAA